MEELWIKKDDYKIDPCATCQPLGAVYASMGFYHALPLVHGSQGCVAYLRSQIIRSYREQVLAGTTALSEEAAVYGGGERLVDSIKNEIALYGPSMIPIFTTCLSETIGDDVCGIVKKAQDKFDVDLIPVSTASYKGDYLDGYDNALEGIMKFYHNKHHDKSANNEETDETVTIIPGFSGPGDMKALQRLAGSFTKCFTIGDISKVLCSPVYDADCHYTDGGTTKEEISESFKSKATVICQKYTLPSVKSFYKNILDNKVNVVHLPVGVKLTDHFVYVLYKGLNKKIPETILKERTETAEVIATCKHYLFNSNAVIFESPDVAYGIASMCLELGVNPVVIASNRKSSEFKKDLEELLKEQNKFDGLPVILDGVDHFEVNNEIRKLKEKEIKIDFIFGNSKAKYMGNENNVSLIRVGFPITDRVGTQRQSIVGYKSMRHMAEKMTNIYIENNDEYIEGVI